MILSNVSYMPLDTPLLYAVENGPLQTGVYHVQIRFLSQESLPNSSSVGRWQSVPLIGWLPITPAQWAIFGNYSQFRVFECLALAWSSGYLQISHYPLREAGHTSFLRLQE